METLNIKRISTHIDERYDWDNENKTFIDKDNGTEIGDFSAVHNDIAEEYSATICKDEDFFIFINNNEYAVWEMDYVKEEAIEIAERYGW
jgi:hypothetical protein